MPKNLQKYFTYKNAYERIDSAIQDGYFLEAITIEESILTDRLFRLCKDNGFSHSWDRATLGLELTFIKNKIESGLIKEFAFCSELDDFWRNRNVCLHQIVKSDLGAPTIEFSELIQLANLTAVAGKTLCQEVNNWVKSYKRINHTNNDNVGC